LETYAFRPEKREGANGSSTGGTLVHLGTLTPFSGRERDGGGGKRRSDENALAPGHKREAELRGRWKQKELRRNATSTKH